MARSSIGWRRSATRNTRADQRSEDGGQRLGWLAPRRMAADGSDLWRTSTEISSGSSSPYQFAALILPILQSSL